MSNENLIYKKAIRILGKDKSDLAKEFNNDYQIEALKLMKKENYSKAILFDEENKLEVLKILGDKDIETAIYIAEIINDKRNIYTNNWKALEYLKNHKFVEYAFYYDENYQIRSLIELGRDNADLAYKFDNETKYKVLNLIGAYRNNSQKIFKIAGEFAMLDYYSSEHNKAFDNLKKCAKSVDCKSKCINEIDDNINFLDCFNDLRTDHQDL